MKRIILAAVLIIALLLVLTGCNRQVLDLNFKFDRAIISLPNGVIVEGDVQSWRDFEDGDQIQVKIDGKTYLTHVTNVVLIAG